MEFRGHHFICLHFFRGEGYTPEFIKNLESLFSEIDEREIKVIMGADDICKPCPNLMDGLCTKGEEKIAELDLLAMNLLNIKPGDLVRWRDVRNKLAEVLPIWKKYACFDCEYKDVCKDHENWVSGD
jgi:hypothetical protein